MFIVFLETYYAQSEMGKIYIKMFLVLNTRYSKDQCIKLKYKIVLQSIVFRIIYFLIQKHLKVHAFTTTIFLVTETNNKKTFNLL